MNKIAIIAGVILFTTFAVGSGVYFFTLQNESYETEALVSENKESSSSSAQESECIITIDNFKYNVADFRKKHPGGDIFKCGEDMTKAFKSQHGAKQLDQIQRYRVGE